MAVNLIKQAAQGRMPLASTAITLLAAAIHAAAFSAFMLASAPPAVRWEAWLVLYLAGLVFICVRPWLWPSMGGATVWRAALAYALLLGALFFGADMALTVLGNSVKPRAPLPAFMGGLELYFVLVPGVATVCLGEFAGACLRSWRK